MSMKLLYKTLPFRDVKTEGDGSEFSGHAAAFHNCDSYGDVILPGAFKDGLDDYMANGQICYEHGPVIGRPLEAREDAKGLFVRGKISDTSHGRDAKTLLRDGVIRKMSIGYRGLGRRQATPEDVKSHWQAVGYQPTKEDLVNLEDNRRNLSFLTAIKLYEASPVGFPANVDADITQVKGQGLRLSSIKRVVAALRGAVKAGRTISQANCARLKAIHDHLHPALADLKGLLQEVGVATDETRPDAPEPDADNPPGDTDSNANSAQSKSHAPSQQLEMARRRLQLLSCSPSRCLAEL